MREQPTSSSEPGARLPEKTVAHVRSLVRLRPAPYDPNTYRTNRDHAAGLRIVEGFDGGEFLEITLVLKGFEVHTYTTVAELEEALKCANEYRSAP